MGRFKIDTANPLSLKQGVRQIKLIKSAGLGSVKSQVRKLVSGDISPADLMDPGKYISDKSKIATLLGRSDERQRPRYFTHFGAGVTDYLVLSLKYVVETVTEVPVQNELVMGSENLDPDPFLSETEQTVTKTEGIDSFVDLSATVAISKKKNVLMTTVAGRDRSRKEYISSGDFIVDIEGVIASKLPEQYPEDEVEMLIKMLESKETLSVENPLLNRFGINGLIILDYKIPQGRATKNTQVYQIKAVYEPPIEFLEAEAVDNSTKLQKRLKAINEWVALDNLTTGAASRI